MKLNSMPLEGGPMTMIDNNIKSSPNDDQYRVSFTNFAFVQDIKSSYHSNDPSSPVSAKANIVITEESAQTFQNPEIQTQIKLMDNR